MRLIVIFLFLILFSCSSKTKPKVISTRPNQAVITSLMDSAFQEECATAIAIYTYILALDSGNAEAYWRRGHEYYRMRNYNMALLDFNNSLRVDSNFSYHQVISDRGQTKDMLHRYSEAIIDFSNAINFALTKDTSIPNGLYNFYYYRANSKLKLRDTASAMCDLDSAIYFWSSHHFAIKRRAEVNTALGNYEAAMKDYDILMSQNGDFPDDPEWSADFYYRAIAKKKTGRNGYSKDYKTAKKYNYYPGKPIYVRGIINCE
jgi:tetratricopeptide (TPR) repeat protein